MHRIQFHYTLTRESPDAGARIRNPLIELLQAVDAQGSISAGARALGLSYRHVWGELKRWEQELGNELLVWEKGQRARLTEFGSKLMWAEGQARVRLTPQIEALRSEIERAYAVAFDPYAHVATLFASHDHALTALREYALQPDGGSGQRVHLDVRFCGSVDAIRALNEGRCVLAGFHALQTPASGSLMEQTYRPLLQPGQHKIIGFARRTQGLMVASGNPLALRSLHDVAARQARFVNRPLGSGTRLLLDSLLPGVGLQASQLNGYAVCEPSHAAVAHAIASGLADVGLGIEAACREHGLDFVPLLEEHYHLVCLKSALDQAPIAALRDLMQQASWQKALRDIPGYEPWECGAVQSLRRVFPWWDFKDAPQ